jgi:hypothetical protein
LQEQVVVEHFGVVVVEELAEHFIMALNLAQMGLH